MSRLGLSPGVSFWKRPNSIGFDVDDIGGVRSLRMDNFVDFLLNDVRVAPQDVEKLQIHPIAPYCFVGLPTEEKMKEVWDRIKDGVRWTGKGFVLPFLCGDTYTEVKVKGCCYGLSEQDLVSIMEYYGEVISCKEFRTRTKGVGGQEGGRTGDFLLKMKLQLPVPRLLPTARDGELWAAFYEGQEDVCWKCFESGHQSRACPNPDQGPRAFSRDQKEERRIQLAALNAAAEEERRVQLAALDTADDPEAVLPDAITAEQDGGGVDVVEGAKGHPQGDTQEDEQESQSEPALPLGQGAAEQSLLLELSATPSNVPGLVVQAATQESFGHSADSAIVRAADDMSAMEKITGPMNSADEDMFNVSGEFVTSTADKRNRSGSTDEQLPKGKEPRVLQPAGLGDKHDATRGSSGNLNAVARSTSPRGTKPNLVARTSVETRKKNLENLSALERKKLVKQSTRGGKKT